MGQERDGDRDESGAPSGVRVALEGACPGCCWQSGAPVVEGGVRAAVCAPHSPARPTLTQCGLVRRSDIHSRAVSAAAVVRRAGHAPFILESSQSREICRDAAPGAPARLAAARVVSAAQGGRHAAADGAHRHPDGAAAAGAPPGGRGRCGRRRRPPPGAAPHGAPPRAPPPPSAPRAPPAAPEPRRRTRGAARRAQGLCRRQRRPQTATQTGALQPHKN